MGTIIIGIILILFAILLYRLGIAKKNIRKVDKRIINHYYSSKK